MAIDIEPKTKIKHVKTRGGPEMKEYWNDIKVPVLTSIKPGETLPVPEDPPATISRPVPKLPDEHYSWQDQDG